jgi:LCP family protein required for cell wall assembly
MTDDRRNMKNEKVFPLGAMSRRRVFLLGIIGLVMLSLVFLRWSYNRVQDVVDSELTLVRPVNILVMGVDEEAPITTAKGAEIVGRRTDALLMLVVRPENNVVTIISIPRDTLVEYDDYGTDRLNLAHAYGGLELTKSSIQKLLKIPVHRYIQVDFEGFIKLVDLLGGIEVTVDKRMWYEDRSAGLKIDIRPGTQVLDGRNALGYVRYRRDALGDIKRVGRQQEFIKALMGKILRPSILLKSPQVYAIARNHFRTDMPFSELMALLRFAQGHESLAIYSQTLPGEFSGPYWKPDTDKIDQLIQPLQINTADLSVFEEKEKVKIHAD